MERLVDAVAGANVDLQLEQPLPQVPMRARVTLDEPVDPPENPPPTFNVGQTLYPGPVLAGRLWVHPANVAYRLHQICG